MEQSKDASSYESILELAGALGLPSEPKHRRVEWLCDGHLGIARDRRGGYELFLPGEPLVPHRATVSRHMEHRLWETVTGGQPFEANRIVLPGAPHFVSVAAFLSSELIRLGLGADDLQAVFERAEPLLEMALQRTSLGRQTVVGLLGELVFLRMLLRESEPERRDSTLDAWTGWTHSARDYQFGETYVEVKTTLEQRTRHQISSLRQVEEARGVLLLLSVGLVADSEGPISLPVLAGQIIELLNVPETPEEAPTRFLERLSLYGTSTARGEPGIARGYVHADMKEWGIYSERFTLGFPPRLYRVTEPSIHVIRTPDLARFPHVRPDGLQYTLELPEVVDAQNPVQDLPRFLRTLVGGAGR